MNRFFYNLGRSVGANLRKGKWVFQSLAGTEDEAIQAEHEVGRDMAWGLLRQLEADPEPAVKQYLEAVGARLAGRVRNRHRRFCFCPVRTAEVNAFALPGGFIFVTRPLLELVNWDQHETAFILGHEMGHVLQGHAMERIMNGWMLHAAGRALPLGGGLAGAWLMQQAAELVHLSYSRDQEMDADLVGVRLTRAAGFDGAAAPRLLGRLQLLPGGDPGLGSYFATHPPFPERIANVQRVLRSYGEGS